MNFPVWRQQLVRSLHVHRSKPDAKYFQVASISKDNFPKLRTMVFRGFQSSTHSLMAVTDIRSEKIVDWQERAVSELHWYFVKSREQYRLSCEVTVIYQDNERNGAVAAFGAELGNPDILTDIYAAQWQALSQNARQGFFCPTPKSPVNTSSPTLKKDESSELREQGHSKEGISQYFALVLLHPFCVDYLDLKTAPHTRTVHTMNHQQWTYQEVNP